MNATDERSIHRKATTVVVVAGDQPQQAAQKTKTTTTTTRNGKIRGKQRSVINEVEDREPSRCRKTESDEFSSFEVPPEPRLRRHCSDKGLSSRSSRQKTRRRMDMEVGEQGNDGSRCNRSLSCRSRAPLRPTELNFAEPRRRTYSMPSKSKRAFIEAQRQVQRSSSSSTPEDFYRVRTFSTSSKGILNKGDSFKRRRQAAANVTTDVQKTNQDKKTSTASFQPAGKGIREGMEARSVKAKGDERKLVETTSAEKSRVLVMGGAGVGKRSIMQQFLTSEYMGTADSSSHENGRAMTVSVILDEEEASLDLIHHPSGMVDLTQSDRADAYCIVYSVSDRDSFLYAREILSELKKRDLQRGAAQILVANKADLVRQRQVSEDEGKLMAARYRGKFIEVSAVLNHKIDDLLVGIVKQIQLKRSADDQKKPADDSGCYPAREIVDLILGKQRRIFHSCDNLLVL